MPLTWDDYHEIAVALEQAHAGTDRLNLEPEQLRAMVAALPEFEDEPADADADTLNAVLTAWIDLEGRDDDSRWDAHV